MRVTSFVIALLGCGPVKLGEEQASSRDADAAEDLRDASAGVQVVVTIRTDPTAACDGCFDLSAHGVGGRAPYAFEWDDGSRASQRRVCLETGAGVVTVIAEDADQIRSLPHAMVLEWPDAGCPISPPPQLCLQNPSFEGTPAYNSGNVFDCVDWSTCTNPPEDNTPDIVNATIEQYGVTTVPPPTDGETFLALSEREQVSQILCESISGGAELSLQFDARRIYIGGGVVPDTEKTFLEIWGGLAGDCSRREILWQSPPLPDEWERICVPLRPLQFTNQLTLRASSDESLPTPAYLLVDNLVPVSHCP